MRFLTTFCWNAVQGSRTQVTSLLCCPWYHDWDLSGMWISHTIVRPLPFSFLFARFLVINLLLCFLTEEKIGAPKGSTTINIFSECTKAESFLPFGSRSRACVGQKFVVLAISMLIASLLRSYEVKCTCSFSLWHPHLLISSTHCPSTYWHTPHHEWVYQGRIISSTDCPFQYDLCFKFLNFWCYLELDLLGIASSKSI
jgi:hypothetical protein